MPEVEWWWGRRVKKNDDEDNDVPRKAEALTGVDVDGWTRANQVGTTHERPITHMYRACPSIATSSDVTIPMLAPAPIMFAAHRHRASPASYAPENGASGSICTHQQNIPID